MKRTTLPLLFAALVMTAGPALAQSKLTPGLWEHQTRIKTGSGQMEAAMAQMQQQLASMPPEQRKQMEEAMGRQGMGMGGPMAPGGAMPIKICLSPEQAARDEVPMQEDGNCKITSRTRSGNTFKFTMACTGPREGSGEGEVTYVSSKEHKGRMKITSKRGGRDETMEMETSAKWLGADCGALKPR
jgi:Protein of unknown function (DUF3617)